MKRITFLIIIVAAIITGCTPSANEADKLIERVTLHTNNGNILTRITPAPNGNSFFEISSKDGKVLIEGNNPVSIATGFNWYLKYTAGIHLTWNNLTQELPHNLPLPKETIRRETTQDICYYLNYCTFSYTMAFWDWERWEKEIDWMALHGINLPLSITGNEVVWYNLLKRIGYSTEEINEFISGPAFMAWWQMNNLEGWGGPNTDEWYRKQEDLQKKIIARMKELGISYALPGYAGMVPRNIGDKLGYRIEDPGKWCTFNRPAFLSPEDPEFNTFADIYYEEMEKLYGKADYYAIDPFHEGGNTEGVDLKKAGSTIMAAMKRANPDAVWVAQAWQANPRKAMTDSLKAHDLLVLDLYSEKRPQWGDPVSIWYRPDGFDQHDWVYCMLLNFGGRVGLHGKMDKVINGYYDACQSKSGQTLKGVGVTAEGIENNPVMYELLYELPWRNERFTKEEWLEEYTSARYGQSSAAVNEAWNLLANSSYACPDDYPGEGTTESVLCARPHLPVDRVSTWGWAKLYYPSDDTRKAAGLLLSVADEYAGNNNFEYDLIDVMRQSIADKGNVLLKDISEAYSAGHINLFHKLSDDFLSLILAQDELLSTRPEFMLGSWLEQAKSLSDDADNKRLYEWNARTLITVWGDESASETGGLHDYSHREWNGLLADLYYKRWKLFFDNKLAEMEGAPFTDTDYYKMEVEWTRESKTYPSKAQKDVIDTAKKIYNQVFYSPENEL